MSRHRQSPPMRLAPPANDNGGPEAAPVQEAGAPSAAKRVPPVTESCPDSPGQAKVSPADRGSDIVPSPAEPLSQVTGSPAGKSCRRSGKALRAEVRISPDLPVQPVEVEVFAQLLEALGPAANDNEDCP